MIINVIKSNAMKQFIELVDLKELSLTFFANEITTRRRKW
jgi:hypothetical protein